MQQCNNVWSYFSELIIINTSNYLTLHFPVSNKASQYAGDILMMTDDKIKSCVFKYFVRYM